VVGSLAAKVMEVAVAAEVCTVVSEAEEEEVVAS